MNKYISRLFASVGFSLTLVASFALFAPSVKAQCPGDTLIAGLQEPTKFLQTPLGNLIVAETGIPVENSGRVSIVGLDGSRRSLLEGLPSGQNSGGDFSGTNGVFLKGRTLYVLSGEGDATLPGPIPGTELPNPSPASPIISSVLAVHFSAAVEKTTGGFVLTLEDHEALAAGETLTFSNGGKDKITVELIADFPNFIDAPLPFFPDNVLHSNPFGLVGIGDQLYISDGGLNAVLQVDIATGDVSTLVTFPTISNPLPFGPPFIEAVPAGIREYNGQLLVALFRGFPFPPGSADIVSVDPLTGTVTPFIDGLSAAISVLPVKTKGVTGFLVLELSTDLLAGDPGRLQRFPTPDGPGIVISDCLIGPTDIVLDKKTGTLYITEIFTGRIIQIPGLFTLQAPSAQSFKLSRGRAIEP